MMTRRYQGAIALFAAVATHGVTAEDAYVIDQLLVGVHENKSLESPIVKAFPTGTKLEVLKREGDLAQVKGPNGVVGWVDAIYLSKNQPAALVVENIEAQNRKLVADLKTAQTKIDELTNKLAAPRTAATPLAADAASADEMRAQNELLQRSLDAERIRGAELQALLNKLQQQPHVDPKALTELTQENDELKAELEEAQIKAIDAIEAARTSGSQTRALDKLIEKLELPAGLRIPAGVLAIIGLALLFASFASGVWFMDMVQRRRHGGFRI